MLLHTFCLEIDITYNSSYAITVHLVSACCWLVRVSLFIDLACQEISGKGGGETLALKDYDK